MEKNCGVLWLKTLFCWFYGLYLNLGFTFKFFGLWLDLDWVSKMQVRIVKYDSPRSSLQVACRPWWRSSKSDGVFPGQHANTTNTSWNTATHCGYCSGDIRKKMPAYLVLPACLKTEKIAVVYGCTKLWYVKFVTFVSCYTSYCNSSSILIYLPE